jgi:hypothetical protein
MKQVFFLPLFVLALSSSAQTTAVNDVLNAEKSFAAYSVSHGTRDAFLKFLDSTGVVFEKGKAVNGIEA